MLQLASQPTARAAMHDDPQDRLYIMVAILPQTFMLQQYPNIQILWGLLVQRPTQVNLETNHTMVLYVCLQSLTYRHMGQLYQGHTWETSLLNHHITGGWTWRRFRIDTEVCCMGAHPPFWPFEPARVKPNLSQYMTQIGRLNLTASAFNQLGQYTGSPGRRGYCYAELDVFFPNGGRNHYQYSLCLPTEGWPGWVGLANSAWPSLRG